MKTDPFDDAIRRKLEGVNPPFQEKNWTQFQRFMGSQGFPPSLWQTPTRWLQPALMAAAVAGMVITTIWQYRTTQSLTEHVQTLTKTVERMEHVQTRLQQSLTAMATEHPRVDTVYLTQSARPGSSVMRGINAYDEPYTVYSPRTSRQRAAEATLSVAGEPAYPAPLTRADRQRTQPQSSDRIASRIQRLGDTRQLGTGQANPANQMVPGQSESTSDQPATEQPQSASDRLVTGRANPTSTPATPDQSRYTTAPVSSIPIPPESARIGTRRTGRPDIVRNNSRLSEYQSSNSTSTSSRSNDPTLYTTSVTNQVRTTKTETVDPAITALGSLASVQPLTPLALSGPSEALAESWQRHLRRVRYRSPYTTTMGATVAAVEPASPAQHTTPLPITFRLGAGGEIGTAQSGIGVYGEAIVADRWTIGTGLSHINWAGDAYATEQVFMAKTKRDFRKDYPGSTQPVLIGPGLPRKVMDISRVGQSLVIPLQVGYRISLGKNYVLTPFVGLNLSLNPRETVTYAFDFFNPRDEVRENLTVRRPALWYSSGAIGAGMERQWGRFTGQVSPVVMVPLADVDACLNSLSVGLRGRLFYRF
ncbi:hypothetical protein [uncultured Fibrella sp.]|uniref:hypothetical protein n=1 Tax=uncultured Fibrella sp. TaxID=1284596 RepID=UPI0035CBFE19